MFFATCSVAELIKLVSASNCTYVLDHRGDVR